MAKRPSSRGVNRLTSRCLLALAVAGSALAVGSVHAVTLCIVAGVLALAAFAGWWAVEPCNVRPVATLLVVVVVGLTVYTALQCVPMPLGWLAHLAPRNADVWARALRPLNEGAPAWAPISLDPGASRIEVLKGAAYLLAFVAALGIARRHEGVTFLSLVVVATGLVLTVVAVLHPAFGLTKLYGWYEPGPGTAERHVAPLMNANNLAAYLDLSFCLVLGMALSPTPRVPRSISWTAVVLLVGGQVWVSSRGGVIAMIIGAAIVVLVTRIERGDARRSTAWVTGVSVACVLAGVVSVVMFSSTEVPEELIDTDTSKAKLFLQVLHVLPSHWGVGVGRGAFESVYPAFRADVGHLTYTNPENLLLQWSTEWGVPVAVAGLLAIGFALRPTAVLPRSRSAVGAWAGLLSVGVHDLADFSTEIPAVTIACVVCAAIVTGGVSGVEPRWRLERWSRHPRLAAVLPAAGALAALLLVVPVLGRGLSDDRRRLQDVCMTHIARVAEVHALVREAMLRHPAEPYLPFAVALRASVVRDELPMPWLEATLERASVYGPAHLLLARLLAPRSPAQARFEYRLAATQAPALQPVIAREAPRLVGGYDDALELVPPGDVGVATLQSLADAVADRLPATRVRLEADVARRAPRATAPAAASALDAVLDLEAGEAAPWCVDDHRAACGQQALDRATELSRMVPASCDGTVLEARVFAALRERKEALRRLRAAATTCPDRDGCLHAFVELAMSGPERRDADPVLEELSREPCPEGGSACVDRLRWVARKQEEAGSLARAAWTTKRAHEAAPWDDALLQEAARLASITGLHAESMADYQLLLKRQPNNAVAWQRKVDEEGEALARSTTTF